MLKGQLFQTLNQYLGEYLYGFNPDQLKLAVLNGNVKLKNLTFRPDKINDHLLMMRAPVLLKAGIIGNITIDINYIDWSKNEIILEDLLIILGPNFSELKTRKNYVANEEKFLNLANKLEDYLQSSGAEEKMEDQDRRGLDMNNLMDRENELKRLYEQTSQEKQKETNKKTPIFETNFESSKSSTSNAKKDIFSTILGLDILTTQRFVAKNIHIRYEDDQLTPKHPISFGFLIESILLHPNPNMDIYIPSSKDSQALGYYNTEKKVLDDFWKTSKERKNLVQQLLINNIEIYMNSASEMYVPYSLYEQTLYSPNGIFEAIPPLELKTLMRQYLTNDDIYKFTILKLERVELHYMISSNLKPQPQRQNFVLLNSTIFNVFFNMKPDIIEDILDISSYFQHFMLWKHLDDFKPNIRPILNLKLVSLKQATIKMRRLVIREWWRSIIWYMRVKKLMEEGRSEIIPELYAQYCKSSWIKILENYKKGTETSSHDYRGDEFGLDSRVPIWDQVSSKKIFKEESSKEKDQKSTLEVLQSKEVKGVLDKMKDILFMIFCNVYNINITAKRNNGKTFLVMRIDQSHLSGLKNYDFKDSNIATMQINNIRLFLCQSEKQKKIFEENAPKESNSIFHSGVLSGSKQPTLIHQELKEIQRVLGDSSIGMKKGGLNSFTPLTEQLNVNKQSSAKQSNFGTLAAPLGTVKYRSSPYTPMAESEFVQGAVLNPPVTTFSGALKKGLEDELQKSISKPNTDLLLLQLKNDIIFKVEMRPSVGQGVQFQAKVEINDINVNIDSEILISIFEYANELKKIYHIRCSRMEKFLEKSLENFKFQAERQILTFQRPSKANSQLSRAGSQKGDLLVKDHEIQIGTGIDQKQIFNPQTLPQQEQNLRNLPFSQQFNPTEIFISKLNDFLECNEFLISLNFDGLNVTLTENSHTLDNRADLLSLQLPKGKINVSFNFNKKNAYIVDVYGFRIETSSKFKALNFLNKKVKMLIENEIDEDDKTQKMFFYDLLVNKGTIKKKVGEDTLSKMNSANKKKRNIFEN